MQRRSAVLSALGVAAVVGAVGGGCGSFGTDANPADAGSSSESSADGSSGEDGASTSEEDAGPPVHCPTSTGPFADLGVLKADGIPTLLSARFVPAAKRVYLSGRPDGGSTERLFVRSTDATLSNDLPFFSMITGTDEDRHATPSSDRLRVVFESKRQIEDSGGNDRLYVAARTDTETPFSPETVKPLKIDPPIQVRDVEEPWIVGNQIYFVIAPAGSNTNEEIWTGTIDYDNAKIVGAKRIVELTQSKDDAVGHPVVTKDRRKIYFSVSSNGQSEVIWVATRESTDDPFGKFASLDLSPGAAAYPTWISDDDCELYFIRKESELHRAKRQ